MTTKRRRAEALATDTTPPIRAELWSLFWRAIAEHAPDAWRELLKGGRKMRDVWLAIHSLTDPWCTDFAEQQLGVWDRYRADHSDETANPERWRANRRRVGEQARLVLREGKRFTGEPLTGEDRRDLESIAKQSEWEATTPLEARLPEVILASYTPADLIPRELCVFRFKCWGWRPDRTDAEVLRENLGWQVEGVSAVWPETKAQATKRIRQSFKRALEQHLAAVGAAAAARRPRRKSALVLAEHLRLLVLYQVCGVSETQLARPHLYGDDANLTPVRYALRDLAERMGLTLRESAAGRPKRKPAK